MPSESEQKDTKHTVRMEPKNELALVGVELGHVGHTHEAEAKVRREVVDEPADSSG